MALIGKKIINYDSVTSTNDVAKLLAEQGELEGTVVVSKGQTHGRGTQGKSWVSPHNLGLYFSFILRPKISLNEIPRITLIVALSAAEVLKDLGIQDIAIKWPNDVLVNNKKICGILTEMTSSGDSAEYAIVGVGVNVNLTTAELLSGATSLKELLLRDFDIAELSNIILKRIDSNYALFLNGEFNKLLIRMKEFYGSLDLLERLS